jgi:parallel beta-helix repeat protein
MLSSNNNSITGNTIMNSTWGIALIDWTNNNIIKGNNLIKNNNGIGTDKTFNNIFTRNNISNSLESGITFELSYNNIISYNNISNNKFGLNINPDFKSLSDSNKIIKNNFIDNNIHAIFNHSFYNLWWANYWDEWDKKTPRPIYGEIKLERLDDRVVPWVQFDWKPATEPYYIGGFDE